MAAGAVSLLSGSVIGHALSISATTLTSATNPTVWGQSVTFTATITPVAPAPAGNVSFQDGGSNIPGCVNKALVARVAFCATATLAVGSHSVTAVYTGNATYAPSTSGPVIQVVNLGTTLALLGSSANPSLSGQAVTYTATVTPVAPASGTRTGTADFQDGGVDIPGCGAKAVAATGIATCAVAYAGPGSHAITAIYSGDTNFAASTAPGLTQTVNIGATTTALSSSVNPSRTGANVTFTARVTATAPASGTRSGTVDFQVDGVDIAGCAAQAVPASGRATCITSSLAVGADTVTATYSGDINFTLSTSAPLTQTVNQGATTIKVVSSLNPSSTLVTVTFTATVTASAPATGARTGTVAFQDGGVVIAACGAEALTAGGTATCVTNALAAGSHPITAVYSGDANFTTSTSGVLTQTVLSTTTTTIGSTGNPSVFGQSVQYTATIAGGPTVTGTVTFRDGGGNIAGCVAVVVAFGSATCTVFPTVVAHAITAVYSGDASNATSTSAAMTQIVTADTTTTAVVATVNPTVFGQPVTLTATVTANAPGSGTPSGNVAFKNGVATIGGCGSVALSAGVATCTTAALSAGVRSITGVYNGNASYRTSTSAVLTETVNLGSTTTVISSSVSPSVSGQSVTYTAIVAVVAPAVGAPSGRMNFEDSGLSIPGCNSKALAAAGTATCSVTYAGAGTHMIIAIYSGDPRFTTSTSTSLTQTVDAASTSTSVASSMNPSVAGQAVTITATVSAIAPGSGARTGTVNFQDGGVTIAGCAAQVVSAAGAATCATSFATVGAHLLTGVYGGDANFTGSTSPALTQTVNQGATSAAVTSPVNPSVSGESLTYTVTVAAVAPASGTPTGAVAFMDGAAAISGCISIPLVAGLASCSVAYAGVGSHAISATYSGEANFTGSTSPVLTQTVSQDSSATAVTSSVNPSVSGQTVAYRAVVTATSPGSGTPTGTVTFMDGSSPSGGCTAAPLVAGVASCTVVYPGVGTHTIGAVYNGDPDFTASTSPVFTQTINQGATATDITSSVNPSVSGEGVSFTATVSAVVPASGTPTGSVTFMAGGSPLAGCIAQSLVSATATCNVTYAGVGTYSITATYSGEANFTSSSSQALAQAVNQAATSTSVASSMNPSVAGQTVTITATVTVSAPGAGAPTGAVAFRQGATLVAGCAEQPLSATGIASCTTSFVAAGSAPLVAVYSGDADFTSSTAASLTQTVNAGATATTVTSTLNPSVPGQKVTYSATVAAIAPASGAPSGTLVFMDGASPIAGCVAKALAGGATSCTVLYAGVGTRAITAIYSGDADFTGSTSPALPQSVVAGASAVHLTSPTTSWSSGTAGFFTATVAPVWPATSSPTGSVAFMDAGSPIAACAAQPLVAGVASCSTVYWTSGVQAITAVYSGSRNLACSSSPTLLLTVYEDPPVPDTGGPPVKGASWGSFVMLGGLMVVFLVGCARLRPRGTGKH